MEAKHTPGPWTVSEEWDGTSIKAGQFHVTHTIQSCGFHEPEVDKAVTQANARLIAAAPELLQAAKDFVEWFECSRIGDKPIAEWSHARAAIAKATGETS
jgi:hypothetical protein